MFVLFVTRDRKKQETEKNKRQKKTRDRKLKREKDKKNDSKYVIEKKIFTISY